MAEFTGEKKYTDSLKKFCDHAINGQTKSPGGMLHYMQWGSLRYAANAAFICLQVWKDLSDLSDYLPCSLYVISYFKTILFIT